MNQSNTNSTTDTRTHLMHIVALAGEYCSVVQTAAEMERDDFVDRMLDLLPRLYWEFANTEPTGADDTFFSSEYVDEDYYTAIRSQIASLMGEEDTYLDTMQEDMKYSDTPIAASISEGLADIFQDLFNFVSEVRESEGMQLEGAFDACQENFRMYWSKALCGVLRPLNQIKYS